MGEAKRKASLEDHLSSWDLLPDGSIRMSIAGTSYWLLPPTIGQLEELELAWAKQSVEANREIGEEAAREKAAKDAAAAADEVYVYDTVGAFERKHRTNARWRAWWLDEAWPRLADKPFAGAPEDLPPWLLLSITVAINHWQTVPTDPGGSSE